MPTAKENAICIATSIVSASLQGIDFLVKANLLRIESREEESALRSLPCWAIKCCTSLTKPGDYAKTIDARRRDR